MPAIHYIADGFCGSTYGIGPVTYLTANAANLATDQNAPDADECGAGNLCAIPELVPQAIATRTTTVTALVVSGSCSQLRAGDGRELGQCHTRRAQ